MLAQKIFTFGFMGLLSASPSFAAPEAIRDLNDDDVRSEQSAFDKLMIAQVNQADLACYVHSLEGQQYDLSALCGGFEAAKEVVLQTGDVQVTLRWATADDLDLYVLDPVGDEVSFFNPAIASGGQLDVDANRACEERMASPVENIFWPTGGGVPGNYTVRVSLFSFCGGSEAPIAFTLTTLVKDKVQTQTGSVSSTQPDMSFPFTFSNDGGAETPVSTLP